MILLTTQSSRRCPSKIALRGITRIKIQCEKIEIVLLMDHEIDWKIEANQVLHHHLTFDFLKMLLLFKKCCKWISKAFNKTKQLFIKNNLSLYAQSICQMSKERSTRLKLMHFGHNSWIDSFFSYNWIQATCRVWISIEYYKHVIT